MADPRDVPVKATQTSVRVLETIVDLQGATLTDLVEEMDLAKSSVHNHLTTLTRLGLVVRDEWTYHVSLRFLQIGTVARERFTLYRVGRSAVAQLASASELEASIYAFEADRLVCLSTATPGASHSPTVDEGDVLPLHCTAPGKAILASLPADGVETLLDRSLTQYTENTLTTTQALSEQFDRIRSQGWTVDREEWQTGLRGIATTVADPNGELLGAIGVTGSTDRLSGKRFQQDVPGLVISTANDITKELQP